MVRLGLCLPAEFFVYEDMKPLRRKYHWKDRDSLWLQIRRRGTNPSLGSGSVGTPDASGKVATPKSALDGKGGTTKPPID